MAGFELKKSVAVLLFAGGIFALISGYESASANTETKIDAKIMPVDMSEASSQYGDYLAARHAETLNDLQAAQDYYQRVLQSDPENLDLLQKNTEMALAIGNIDLSLKIAKTLGKLEPENDLVVVLNAIDAFRTRSYRAALRVPPESVQDPLYYMLMKGINAWALVGSGKAEEAIAVLQQPARYPWEGWFTSYLLAQVEDWRGNPKAALETFQPVYLAQQDVAEIVVTLAILHARAGEPEKGQAALAKYLENRSDLEVSATQSMLQELAARPIVSSPQQAVALLSARLASDLSQQKEYARALQLVSLGQSMSPKNDNLAFQRAQILFSMGRYEEVIGVVDTIPSDAFAARKALILKAIAFDQLDKKDDAEALLGVALEADFSNFEAIMYLGDLQRSQKKFVQAAATYSRAIEQDPSQDNRFWRFYFNRAVAYERANMWDKAEADFLKALDMVPNHPKILNYLGYSWIDQGLNLDEALKMVEKAAAISPRDGFIIDSLGWGLYRLGRFDEAVEKLEIAAQLEPVDPVINDHLGDAYWMVGRKREARFQWDMALANDPDPDLEKSLRDKLENGLNPVSELKQP